MSNLRSNARFIVSTVESHVPRVRQRAQVRAIANSHWNNWVHTQSCISLYTYQPRDDEGVISVTKTAKTEGTTVRPLGTGHSFTSVVTADGHRTQLDRCSDLVELDAANQAATLRTDTRLHDTPGILHPLGWALPNQGDVDPQSLAGAISAGTHGTGLGFTGFAGTVKGFKVVTADGVVGHCRPDAEGINDELYRLGRLGLGVFSVLTEVTMSVVPALDLHADEHREESDSLRRSPAERCKEADHLEFFWSPGQRETLVKHNTRIEPQRHRHPSRNSLKQRLGSIHTYLNDEVISNMGLLACCEIAKVIPITTNTINRVATNIVPERRCSNGTHKVFVSPRRVRFSEIEYSVPLEVASDVLGEIRDAIARKRMKVSFLIEVRSAKADDVVLSTTYGRDSVHVAIHRYWKENYREYFNLIELIFKAHEGRPHWGKLHTPGAEDFTERYPLFGEVQALREKVDLQGIFLNEHLHDLFC